MDEARLQRVRAAIRQEVSDILRGFKDPRLGFVSVTDVEVSRDGRVAKVFVSVLGSEGDKEKSLAALRSGVGFVRSELGRRLRLRLVPEVVFRLDESIERGTRVQSILGQLRATGGLGDPAAQGEGEE
ncbi:MAG: 30S ribosome-binding factor RbfA [Firmicutes bacterium]|nr:30S ribosome-binding factor RbfA [Bacillota bacterium]